MTLVVRHDQHQAPEFLWLLEKMKGAKSILEIGTGDGQSLESFASVCPGARLRFIDHRPVVFTDTPLLKSLERMYFEGFDVLGCIMSSHSEEARLWARQWEPYDFVFIDGDRSYPGVKEDWGWYGTMSKLVGFHDIAHDCGPPDDGVMKLWPEIKASFRTEEFVYYPGSMGTGIVYR